VTWLSSYENPLPGRGGWRKPDGVGRRFEVATHPQGLAALSPPKRGLWLFSFSLHTAHLSGVGYSDENGIV
jgi:hypothetical protein